MRAQKAFTIKEGYQLQLLANVFNIANHQNIDGINTTAYLLLLDRRFEWYRNLSIDVWSVHQFQQQRLSLH